MDSLRTPGKTSRWHAAMLGGLSWPTSHSSAQDMFAYRSDEGLVVHDGSTFEIPGQLAMGDYWKIQNEKDRRLYSLIEAFAQNNGQLGVSDARYANALKIIIQAFTPLQYCTHRSFAHVGRQVHGDALRLACQIQSLDSLRHFQIHSHAFSHFNKYFSGLNHAPQWFDQAWYLAPAKSFADDVASAGPMESLVAINFCWQGLFGSLLNVSLMSGAARNGDLCTANTGYSTGSDATRHIAVGVALIQFLAAQDPANLPILQAWIDKWFWRSFRLMSLVAMAQDYMLTKHGSSWQDHWQQEVEAVGAARFADLAACGLRLPAGWGDACAAKAHLSHQTWNGFYGHSSSTAFHTWVPNDDELNWLHFKYPDSFNKYYRPRLEYYRAQQAAGQRWQSRGRPMWCRTCHFPAWFTQPGQPRWLVPVQAELDGQTEHFCSVHCRNIFQREPAKYQQSQPRLQQFLAAQAGATGLEFDAFGAAAANGVAPTEDGGGEFIGSADQRHFREWGGGQSPSEGRL